MHGDVQPLQPAVALTADGLRSFAAESRVPLWLPWPLPLGWLVTGLTYAGDDRTGPRATVLVCSGPAPLGGAADLLVLAEEPGIGLGAHFGGLPGPDPGDGFMTGPPSFKAQAVGHVIAMWEVMGEADRSVFVGEARGHWLWMVTWPETASLMLYDRLHLVDLRGAAYPADIPFGARSPRLR